MSNGGAANFATSVTANAGPIQTLGGHDLRAFTSDNSSFISIKSNEIDVGSGNLTLDVAGDIILDSDGGLIEFKNGGTRFGRFTHANSNLELQSMENSGDILLRGKDSGGNNVTALTLDMSNAGSATFNSRVGIGTTPTDSLLGSDYGTTLLHIDGGSDRGQVIIEGDTLSTLIMSDNGATANSRVFIALVNDGSMIFKSLNDNGTSKATIMSMTSAGATSFTGAVTANAGVVVDNFTLNGTTLALSSGDMTLDVAGDIVLDADGGDILFADGGTLIGDFENSNSDFKISSLVADKDLILGGNDGGSFISALTLDMSAAGYATFNNYVQVNDRIVGNNNLILVSHDSSEKIHMDASGFIKFETAGGERFRIASDGAAQFGFAGAALQQADSQALSIITPASGGGQGIAIKRLDTNNDQSLGEISWSNNTQDGQANIRVKTDGAANTTDMAFDISNAGTVTQVLNFDGSAGGAATFNSSVTIPTTAYVGTSIVHNGDADTSIDFDTNLIDVYAGGVLGVRVQPTAVTINETGGDKDFRVESNSNTHMLFVDGENNRVGIGIGSPVNPLHLFDSSATSQLLIQGDSNDASIKFNKSGQTFIVGIDATDDSFKISDNLTLGSNDRLTIASDGAATFTGAITANAGVTSSGTGTFGVLTVDTMTLNASSITGTSNLTLDIAGDINLDAGGADVTFKNSGTEFGRVFGSSDNFYIQARQSDKDMIFQGIDGASTITALTLDMSNAGRALFNNGIGGTYFEDSVTPIINRATNTNTAALWGMYAQYRNVSANGAGAGMSLGMETANGTEAEYAYIGSIIEDNTNSAQYGAFVVAPVYAGTRAERLRITSAGSITTTPVAGTAFVINEGGVDADFRVESNNNANLFNIDGGTDEVRIGTNAGIQSIAHLGVRQNGSAIEFGHENNSGGYYGTVGAFGSSGRPYIGFSTFCEASVNTFTTTGSKGHVINGDLSGNLLFSRVETASATGQTPTTQMTLNSDGTATFSGDISVPNISVADDIRHTGDSDTYISFETNNQTFYAGGTRLLDLTSGNITFNEGGGDVDFRVESAVASDSFFVDGANGYVGINDNSPSAQLNLNTSDGLMTILNSSHTNGGYVRFEKSGTVYGDLGNGAQIVSGGATTAFGINTRGTGDLLLATNGVTRASIQNGGAFTTNPLAGGHAVFNEGGVDSDFRVESDGDPNMLFVDGGNNRVVVGSNTGDAVFAVKRNSPDGGRLASFGSVNVAGTDACVGTVGAVSIARSMITVQPNTVTNLVNGYGGSHVMIVVNSPSGVADVQRTIVATHAWSQLSVLFSNNYGSNNPTFTFSVGSGVLKVSHNHSGALQFGVACLIVPSPTSGA